VWDGLRADDFTPDIAPNYFALARSGIVFADHHAVYPTFTMMNSASIATGAYPGVHGFYGNVVYAPSAKGRNAKGAEIDFSAPAFIEDFGVVEAVRDAHGYHDTSDHHHRRAGSFRWGLVRPGTLVLGRSSGGRVPLRSPLTASSRCCANAARVRSTAKQKRRDH
jgi:hypothetical protein